MAIRKLTPTGLIIDVEVAEGGKHETAAPKKRAPRKAKAKPVAPPEQS